MPNRNKVYAGKPNLDEGWLPIGLTEEICGTRWFVSIKERGGAWRSLKISAYDNPVPHKANYWSGWDGERLGESRDIQIMKERRPLLYEAILEIMDKSEAKIAHLFNKE